MQAVWECVPDHQVAPIEFVVAVLWFFFAEVVACAGIEDNVGSGGVSGSMLVGLVCWSVLVVVVECGEGGC